jgi:hypothetical protein
MPDNIEYEVWYDDVNDGSRKLLRATSKDAVKDHISYLRAQDDQRQLLAGSIGLKVDPHEYNIEIVKVTTQTEKVTL